jgi:PTS system mannose-specific IIA component
MLGLVLVAHAPLAGATLACVKHVLGQTPPYFEAVDVLPDTDLVQARTQIKQAVKCCDADGGVLILSDIFGATPSNLVMDLINSGVLNNHCSLVSGFSLPMVLRALTYRERDLNVVLEKVVSGGREGVVSHGLFSQQIQSVELIQSHVGTSHNYQQ